jgi:hypothetical protein
VLASALAAGASIAGAGPVGAAGTPAAARSTGGWLNGVACPTAGECVAVGYALGTDSNGYPLAATRAGSTWATSSPPRPAGSFSAPLVGIACPSARSCFAVGTAWSAATPGDSEPFADRWNLSSWSGTVLPQPAGSKSASLSGISCASAVACVAVGNFQRSLSAGARQFPLVERWNGKSWIAVATLLPAGETSAVLTAVSCPSATACRAVGSDADGAQAFAYYWNGRTWSSAAISAPGDDPILAAISCATTTSCTAVGYTSGASGVETLAEQWSGSSWASSGAADPPQGTGGSELSSVSCIAGDACVAAGEYLENPYTVSFALSEEWNGSTWELLTTPEAPDGSGFFSGVTCVAAGSCEGVGTSWNYDFDNLTFAEGWNGKVWKYQAT